MNKYVFVAFAIFIVINSVLSDDSSEEVIEKVKSKHLRKYLTQNKEHIDGGLGKLEKHCPGASEKLKTALKEFHECDDKADESLTMCAAIQAYTLNCTSPLLRVVDDCLPQKAKGLPKLGVKSLLSVSEHLCKQTGESIFELLNPCLYEDLEESNDELEKCENKLKEHFEKYQNTETIPTTTETCNLFTSMRSCVQTHVNKACKNAKTKEAAIGLYDALVAPCSHLNEV